MSIFGWSLPPGCTRVPGDEDDGDYILYCPECQAAITDYMDEVKPARLEPWEDWLPAPPEEIAGFLPLGPFRGEGENREVLLMAGVTIYYQCPNCGAEVKDEQ